MLPAPDTIESRIVARLPDSLRRRAPYGGGLGERDSFLEGPAFDRRGTFHCTDLHNGRILRVAAGRVEVACEYDGAPNGLKVHADGRLFVACNRRGIVAVDPATGAVTPVVDAYRGEPLRAPNDLVFARSGDLYFTDPGEADLRDPHGRLYRLRATGELELLIDRLPFPNGVALTGDERLLYIAMTRTNQIWRVGIMPDGRLHRLSVFVQLSGGLSGPDGLAVDESGNLAVAHFGRGTVWLLSRLGDTIARIRSAAGLGTTNVAFGGPDGRSLWITEAETGTILEARMPAAGLPLYGQR